MVRFRCITNNLFTESLIVKIAFKSAKMIKKRVLSLYSFEQCSKKFRESEKQSNFYLFTVYYSWSVKQSNVEA